MPSKEPEDSILEGIYQKDVSPLLTDSTSKEFKPWHKPRKHHIRIYQWCELIADLMKELRLPDSGKQFRYLGMPGEDFLDIRTLEGVCNRNKVILHYLGFDSTHPQTGLAGDGGDDSEFYLSRHEVSQPGFVDQTSVVLRRRIEEAAQEKSIAFGAIDKHGPFDVINIDLCDSVAIGKREYFEAIKRLCDHQTKTRTKPWLLFLATRVDRQQMDDDIKRGLLNCIITNVDKYAPFTAAINGLGLNKEVLSDEISREQLLSHKGLFDAFVLGLGKWLLQLMDNGKHPRVAVSMHPSYAYRVYGTEADMISLAFRMEPLVEARVDSSGVTLESSAGAARPPSEGELAISLAGRVRGVVDVDALLAKDPVMLAKAVKGSKELLLRARYPIDKYDQWAQDNTPPVNGDSSAGSTKLVELPRDLSIAKVADPDIRDIPGPGSAGAAHTPASN